MKKLRFGLWGWGALLAFTLYWSDAKADHALKIIPSQWGIYQGAFPDFYEGSDFAIKSKMLDLESKIARPLALVTYVNDWVDGPFFPWDALDQISSANRTILIRIQPRSTRTQDTGSDPIYSLRSFLRGDHDRVLRDWARSARQSGTPIMIDWAPEMNGRWYAWNGLWNGGGYTDGYGDPRVADGPERYRDVYRRVIDIFRFEGATNVTFLFHVDSQPKPVEPWNSMANYYPGDDYVDWLGISVFGAQYPWQYWDSFVEVLDRAYPEFAAISPNKPLSIPEFGVIEDAFDSNRKALWIEEALTSILDERYPRLKMISYWHEASWIPTQDNNLRLDSSPQALHAYWKLIQNPNFLSEVEVTW